MVGPYLKLIACASLCLAAGTSALAAPRAAAQKPAFLGFSRSSVPGRKHRASPAASGTRWFVPPAALAASAIAESVPWKMADSDGGGGGPAVLDRPETVEKVRADKDEDAAKEKQRQGSEGWEVRLYNDPYNKREFVARCLTEVCGMSDGESYQVMMQAHQHGLAVIGRYVFERAELYHQSLRENGLFVDMVPVDED